MSSLAEFQAFCRELVLDNRQPMQLEPFQRVALGDYFAGIRETLILLPKKNGKTSLLAALALYHLLTTRDAECVIAAASREGGNSSPCRSDAHRVCSAVGDTPTERPKS